LRERGSDIWPGRVSGRAFFIGVMGSMDNALKELLALRDIDENMARIRKKLEDKPARLGKQKREVDTAEQDLEGVRDHVKQLQQIVDRKTVELRAVEDDVQKLSGQLNTLKTNEEYQTMQRQIEAKKGEISLIEDAVLESMEVVEKAKVDLPDRKARLDEERDRLTGKETELATELDELTKQMEALESDWQAKSHAVDPDALTRYQTLRSSLGHTALVAVSPEGICQGCYTKVTSNILNTALAGRSIDCNNCHRLIYMLS